MSRGSKEASLCLLTPVASPATCAFDCCQVRVKESTLSSTHLTSVTCPSLLYSLVLAFPQKSQRACHLLRHQAARQMKSVMGLGTGLVTSAGGMEACHTHWWALEHTLLVQLSSTSSTSEMGGTEHVWDVARVSRVSFIPVPPSQHWNVPTHSSSLPLVLFRGRANT